MVVLRNPDAPATKRQLFKLQQLTDEDTRNLEITKQEASDKIGQLIDDETDLIDEDSVKKPFSEPRISLINGAQRSGKTTLGIKYVIDAYYKDCVKCFCENSLGIDCIVKSYKMKTRIAKIKYRKYIKYIHIPEDYKLHSNLRVFSRIHLFGIPYVYVPSYSAMLEGLKNGFIANGWLLADEAHQGMSARGSMTKEGKEWVAQYYQFGKSHLDVVIITHQPRMIDYLARMVPTKQVTCTYDKDTKKITYRLRQKGTKGVLEKDFYAPDYWKYFNTDEKVTG